MSAAATSAGPVSSDDESLVVDPSLASDGGVVVSACASLSGPVESSEESFPVSGEEPELSMPGDESAGADVSEETSAVVTSGADPSSEAEVSPPPLAHATHKEPSAQRSPAAGPRLANFIAKP
jgi:hypothetical protein